VASPLTERQRRFVEAYMGAANGSATLAAKMAGYGSGSVSVSARASALMKLPQVQSAIAERAAADPLVADRERRQRFWTQVMEGDGIFAKAKLVDRLKASELLAKSQGDFVERRDHRGSLTLRVLYEDESPEPDADEAPE